MPIMVASILAQAGTLLQDDDHVRWPLAELAAWIDDAIRAIVLAKPNSAPIDIALPLQAGTMQTIPQTGTPTPQALISLTRNLRQATPVRLAGRAIAATNRLSLDGRAPHWHDERRVPREKEVRQFYADPMDPLRFWVYPGNDGTGLVEAIVSAIPAPIAPLAGATGLAAYETALPMLRDQFATPILDYVCFRAQSKDDVAANAGRAAVHYQSFATAIGVQAQAEASAQPNRRTSG
ncbi:hypothetical protein [Microcystis phage Mwe-JY25]